MQAGRHSSGWSRWNWSMLLGKRSPTAIHFRGTVESTPLSHESCYNSCHLSSMKPANLQRLILQLALGA
jgi:hypothetical protein